MEEEARPFDPTKSTHYPIRSMDNPKTPIEHDGRAAEENLKAIVDKSGEGVLPKVKVSQSKSN